MRRARWPCTSRVGSEMPRTGRRSPAVDLDDHRLMAGRRGGVDRMLVAGAAGAPCGVCSAAVSACAASSGPGPPRTAPRGGYSRAARRAAPPPDVEVRGDGPRRRARRTWETNERAWTARLASIAPRTGGLRVAAFHGHVRDGRASRWRDPARSPRPAELRTGRGPGGAGQRAVGWPERRRAGAGRGANDLDGLTSASAAGISSGTRDPSRHRPRAGARRAHGVRSRPGTPRHRHVVRATTASSRRTRSGCSRAARSPRAALPIVIT